MSVGEKQLDAWWLEYKENSDPTIREQLIMTYLHLVKYVAGRWLLAFLLPLTTMIW